MITMENSMPRPELHCGRLASGGPYKITEPVCVCGKMWERRG